MSKVMLYAAWIIMLAGVVVQRFVYEFPVPVYILFLAACVLLGVAGYFVDRRKNKKG